mmetsp:Transcript_34140/g.100535  ORF Transcript_34140/g.100535 Transcript_34140/m.100535 type:complete len:245 (+) Transcript_34140:414-1148(+)
MYLAGGALGLVNGLGQSLLGLGRQGVLLLQLGGLGNGLLDQITHNTQCRAASAHQVVLLVDLGNLLVGGIQRGLELGNGVGIDVALALDLGKGLLEAGLGLGQDGVLVVELGEVVVDLDGGLGNGADDVAHLGVGLGGVVGGRGGDGGEGGAAEGQAHKAADEAGGEFNGLLLDGDELAAGGGSGGGGSLLLGGGLLGHEEGRRLGSNGNNRSDGGRRASRRGERGGGAGRQAEDEGGGELHLY